MWIVRPLVERRTYRELLFLLSGAPFAGLWFGLLLAGWLGTGLLAVTPFVVPMFFLFRTATRLAAVAEAATARELLGVDVYVRGPAGRGSPGYWGRLRADLSDASFWTQQAYLALRTTVGFGLAVGVFSFVGVAVQLLILPATYSWVDEDVLGAHVGSLGEALALVPLGLVGLVAAPWLVRACAAPWRRAARLLAVEPGPPGAPATEVQAGLRRTLPAHVAFYLGLNAVLIAIWALTTRSYFWPEWTLMSLGLPLAAHAWTVFVDRGDPRRIARTRALAIHLGASTALLLYLVLIWAVTTRGYFWPVWAALGLVVVAGAHALASTGKRIDALTVSRAGAVDAAEDELRRIERDLHDGAQARLVALGMSIGMAEQRLAEDPEAARALLVEARVGASEALRELRDLARGIHPPVLADRGLEAALAALVARSPQEVGLSVGLADRPPAAVETAVYFVVAEALANASKHAPGSRVDVRLAREDGTLVAEVRDDGPGGADPEGDGLSGIRRRVEALDGTLSVTSPAGGPTTVRAVMPCEQ